MNTINKYDLAAIFGYLGQAAKAAAEDNKFGGESHCQWTIRMASERLLAAALTDLQVEPLTAGEIEDASARVAA